MAVTLLNPAIKFDLERLHSLSLAFFKAVSQCMLSEQANGLLIEPHEYTQFEARAASIVKSQGNGSNSAAFAKLIEDARSYTDHPSKNKLMTASIGAVDIWAGVAIRAWGADMACELFSNGYKLLIEWPLWPSHQDAREFIQIGAPNLAQLARAAAKNPKSRFELPANIAELTNLADHFLRAANAQSDALITPATMPEASALVNVFSLHIAAHCSAGGRTTPELIMATIKYADVWAAITLRIRQANLMAVLPANAKIAKGYKELGAENLAKICSRL